MRAGPSARAVLGAGALALALAACGGRERSPATPSSGPGAHDASVAAACRDRPGPRVLFLALEPTPDLLQGMRAFASDWGRRLGCFRGRVAATAREALADPGYDVLMVDVGYDRVVSPVDAAAIRAGLRDGKAVALFALPGLVSDHSPDAAAISALAGLLPGLRFRLPVSTNAQIPCDGMAFTASIGTRPFDLAGASLFYESPFLSVFSVGLRGPSRTLARALHCTPGTPTMVRQGRLVVAGFSLGYEVARADDNVPTVVTKEVVVDLADSLSALGQR